MTDQAARAYEEELLRLRSLITEMGTLTMSQLEGAIDAMESFSLGAATAILEREPEADRLEHQIDRLVIRLIALRQPVATDLRQILAALRTANELERVCDHAEDMVKQLIALQPAPEWARALAEQPQAGLQSRW